MHIIMMVIGVLAGLGALIWRIQMAAQAAREVGDLAKTAANLPRRLAFRHKTGKRGSKLVTDPREAATVLMLEIARENGDISKEQKTAICDMICEHFDFSAEDAEELMTQAAWVSQEEARTTGLQKKMIRLIMSSVTEAELVSLSEMLEHVARAEQGETLQAGPTLQIFREMTGLQT